METSAQGSVVGSIAVIYGGVILYGLPAFIAFMRYHHLTRAIVLIDILVGWTVVGWAIALVMALSSPHKKTRLTRQDDTREQDIENSIW